MAAFDITPAVPAGRQLIQSYGEGRFRIAGTVHTGSILVFPTRTVAWAVTGPAAVTPQSLAPIAQAEEAPEILLVGCGPAFLAPPAGLADALREHGLVLDWMDTGAACRTFNVLLAEDRLVAAALIAVE